MIKADKATKSAILRATLPLAALALLAWPTASLGAAGDPIPFPIADVFFEFNSTPNDLGVHIFLDAESWKEVRIEGPGGRKLMTVSPQGGFKKIGLTELFFEGDEPSLAEVPFSEFLLSVPLGKYIFTGTTTDNQRLRSIDRLTADIPCPVTVTSPAEDASVAFDQLVVAWDHAPGIFDPDGGACEAGEVELVEYQVIVSTLNVAKKFKRELIVNLPAKVTSFPVPGVFLRRAAAVGGTVFQIELLAIEDSGNKTITERNFTVPVPAP